MEFLRPQNCEYVNRRGSLEYRVVQVVSLLSP